MSFLTAGISAIHQPQQLPSMILQNSSDNNVTTIANNSINDNTFTAIENGISLDYQQHAALSNVKVNLANTT